MIASAKRLRARRKHNGVILYEGPSMLDGAPIVVIATGFTSKSRNAKTGAMIHIWILRADVHPVQARRMGKDYSICGNCSLRDGRCYVRLGNAPAMIYGAYHRGSYRKGTPADLQDHVVRIGAYGDPAAAPVSLWRDVVTHARKHTGYTHSRERRPSLRGLVMASCESADDAARAAADGWGVFLVLPPGVNRTRGQAQCRAERNGTQCADCTLCDGRGAVITIAAHGGKAAMTKWNKLSV